MDIDGYQTEKRTNRIIFILAIIVAVLVTGIITGRSQVTALANSQEELAQKVLRFHILANSDSEEDQELKLKVRNQVLEYLEAEMPKDMDVDGTKEWMRLHTGELEDIAQTEVFREQYAYPVNVAVTTCYFPDKTYEDATFPAGNYEALRIEIGAAKGHNWWCVLYPNLSFEDAVNAVVPDEGKEKLNHVLTEEEYSEVTAQTDFKIKWYFWRNHD